MKGDLAETALVLGVGVALLAGVVIYKRRRGRGRRCDIPLFLAAVLGAATLVCVQVAPLRDLPPRPHVACTVVGLLLVAIACFPGWIIPFHRSFGKWGKRVVRAVYVLAVCASLWTAVAFVVGFRP